MTSQSDAPGRSEVGTGTLRSETNDQTLSPQLQTLADEIENLLERRRHDEMDANFKIGVVASRAKDSGTYEKDALPRLEKRFGLAGKTLYRYSLVAERFQDEAQVNEILFSARDAGAKISWSHIELLASVESETSRSELIDATIAEKLSVKDLGARVKAVHATGKVPKSAVAAAQREIARALRATEKCVDAVETAITTATPDEVRLLAKAAEPILDASHHLEEFLNAATGATPPKPFSPLPRPGAATTSAPRPFAPPATASATPAAGPTSHAPRAPSLPQVPRTYAPPPATTSVSMPPQPPPVTHSTTSLDRSRVPPTVTPETTTTQAAPGQNPPPLCPASRPIPSGPPRSPYPPAPFTQTPRK